MPRPLRDYPGLGDTWGSPPDEYDDDELAAMRERRELAEQERYERKLDGWDQ